MAFLSLAAALLGLAAGAREPGPAGDLAAVERGVKAAYLYQFANFVEWPGEWAGPLRICVLGDDPMGEALDRAVSGKTVRKRVVSVHRLARASDARSCAVLFVSSAEVSRTEAIVAELRGAAVLTVGDSPEFAERGGVIGFFVKDGKVRFAANLAAAEAARLRISARLLDLARLVGPRSR